MVLFSYSCDSDRFVKIICGDTYVKILLKFKINKSFIKYRADKTGTSRESHRVIIDLQLLSKVIVMFNE